ncbi:DMT family transporter [Halomonas campisalis]|uniref:DMT family transporter n=1 Tax=Billgrantia campisalis TaxID=74661 RepID=A0ABS9PEV3_9GAMM|nr:DMT family transporter [Halomonas campisalis]MCG6659655.1 DMT family transporter [Halomonas campisalis]MDR5864611.1 DMT family transporter [Halomonas campisalis]
MTRPLSHWGLLVALAVIWGSSFALTRIAVAELTPAMVVAGRNMVAALGLLALVVVLGRAWPRGRRVWGFMLAIAVIGNMAPFLLISWGQQRIDSGLAGILMAVMPLVTLVLAHFLVPGETLTRQRLLGFSIGFVGILALIGPAALRELGGRGETLVAQLAVLLAACCYAVNAIVSRHKPASDAWSTSALVLGMAWLLTLPLALTPYLGGASPGLSLSELSAGALWAVLVLGIVCTALGSVVFFTLVAAAGPTFLSLINYLIPLWAVVIGILFLGERPEWNHLLALLLILAGVAISQRR